MISTHTAQRRLLAQAISRGKLSHAYLFAGPEGAGKRTLALELAAALVCEKPDESARSFPPCAQCSACRRAISKTHPDVTVVEPEERSIKIGQVRELSSRLHHMSFEGGYKAGIVPDAERMTLESQNAFLKTLEEPPPDTVLILTCTNLNRLLPTIISRCQVLRIPPLPESALCELLIKERGLDPDQSKLVAALSQGNAKRALEMDLEFIVQYRKDMISRLLELDPEDRIALLAFAQQLYQNPYPIEAVLDLLSGFYHDVLSVKLGRDQVWNQDLFEAVSRQARRASLKRILQQMESIHTARVRAAGNANPRLNWEVLVMALKGVQGAELKTT